MARLPARVKVGAIVYRVQLVERLADTRGKLDGQVHHQSTTIRLEQGQVHQAQVQTLLHELVHIVAAQLGAQDVSEGMVDAIAYAVYQVLRDNPELTRAIMRQET